MDAGVSIFFAMCTQWRWVGAGMAGAFRTGLEYAALPIAAAGVGAEMTPRVFGDIRLLERECLAVWSRK